MIKLVILGMGALWLGCMAAFLTHAILFTTPLAELLPEILLPVLLLAGAGALAGYLAPAQAKTLALLAALPLIITSIFFLLAGVLGGAQDVNYNALRTYIGFPVIALAAPVLTLITAHVVRGFKA